MKGVEVDRSDNANHGNITNYHSAGRFEFVEIATVSGNQVTLAEAPVVNYQVSGAVQLIRVEKFSNKTIKSGTTISAKPWDGKTGGVVAIDDTGTLTLEGTIDVSGLGFKGGLLAKERPFHFCLLDQSNYTGPMEIATGNKGKGVVVDDPSHRARKGHNANGGGGGNVTDGGGGGSGSEVSQPAQGGPRTGGGIIIIRAKQLASKGGALLAKGLSSNNDDGNGADGGGAGGSIGLVIARGVTGFPEIEVQGGHGGDEYDAEYAHGTGGGGGGTVILNGPSCSSVHWSAKGGNSGISKLGAEQGDPKWGAEDGESGSCLTNFTNLPPIEPPPPPSPSMNIMACSYETAVNQTPDGVEDLAFPKGYWATSYYKGTDGVENSVYSNSGLDAKGNAGFKEFMGEAFIGENGNHQLKISSDGSLTDARWSQHETPTFPKLPHKTYTGETWRSLGNPFYQIDMRQKMAYSGELKIGYGEQDYVDDVLEVFVNGVRVYAWFSGGGAPNESPGAGKGQTIAVNANDEVMIRFMNWGNVGGFNLELSSPMPDCSDSPRNGSVNPSGNINNYGSAHHNVISDVKLGSSIDGEYQAIASSDASGDGNDDDGVVFEAMVPGESTTVTATVSGDGYLQAWVDWNGDGDFGDSNEKIAMNL